MKSSIASKLLAGLVVFSLGRMLTSDALLQESGANFDNIIVSYLSLFNRGINILFASGDLILSSSWLNLIPCIFIAASGVVLVWGCIFVLSVIALPFITFGWIFFYGGPAQFVLFAALGLFCVAENLRDRVVTGRAQQE